MMPKLSSGLQLYMNTYEYVYIHAKLYTMFNKKTCPRKA